MKGLFDFTRVVDSEVEIHKHEEIKNISQTCNVVEKAVSVYLASEQGFDNYCRDCANLVAVQIPRVFCSLEKCVK